MEKHGGTLYRSRWDLSTWLILLFEVAVCIWPVFIELSLLPIVLAAVFPLMTIFFLLGIYYRIDGNNLVVYELFRPTAYPIDKIAEIRPTKSVLSSPAASLTHRLAIKFTDRAVPKSTMPLIISPERQKEFIEQLLSINPDIRTH